jgi:predicted HD phosphohydrolase
MKELTPEQIQENWDKLIELVNDTFEGERLEKLLEMYDYFEERMCLAPASGKEHYHNAYVGGYVEHVLHVVELAVEIKESWEKNGATINFTDEELVFAALHHDLGKVGDLAEDYYVVQDNNWFVEKRGEYFKHNPKLQFMTVTDRAVFLLQHFGIPMTELEYIGLRLTDGMYEEANKNYYVSYQPERSLKSNIAYILHQADSMATHIEYDMWKRGDHDVKVEPEKQEEKSEKSKRAHDLFKELFDE